MPSIAINVQGYVYDFQVSDKDTIQGLITSLIKNQLVNKNTPSHFIQIIPENGLCYQETTKIIDLIRQHIKMLFVRCAKVQGLQLNNEYYFKGAKHLQAGKRNAQNMVKVRQQQIEKLNQKLQWMNGLHQAAVDEYYKMKAKNTQLQTKLNTLEKQPAVHAKNSYSQSQVHKLKEEILQGKKRQQKLSQQNYQLKSKIYQLQQNIKMSKISVLSNKSDVAANNSGIRNTQKILQISDIGKNKNLGYSQKVILQSQEYIIEAKTTNPNKKQTGVQGKNQATSKIEQQSKISDIKSSPPIINKVTSQAKIPNYSTILSQQPALKKQQSKKSDISDRSNQGFAASYSPYNSQLKSSKSNYVLNSYRQSEIKDKTNYDKNSYKYTIRSNEEKQKQRGQNVKKY